MNKGDYQGKRSIGLARVSNDSDGNSSTEAQLAMLSAGAVDLGMIPVDEIAWEGLTGSLPGKREDLQALLDRKKTVNDFDVLVVQRLDRLTRSGSAHGFWFEHECRCAGIELLFLGDDIPEGRYANLIKVAKYEAAQEQAFSISQRSAQGSQLALEAGRNITSAHTPYGCWRLYLTAEGKPSHVIRDMGDGRQQKLHPETYQVIDIYGQIGGGGKGHYRKQKTEKVLLMPGDPAEVAVVREIFRLHFLSGWGGKRIADLLNGRGVRSPQGKQWSQHQVEVIYEQEVYTGRSVGNRSSSAIYHERQTGAPKTVKLDPAILATAKNIPVRQRSIDDWFIQSQPLMADFLDPEIRKLALAKHENLWQRRGDPDRPKRSKSRHQASDYLLSGLFFAKQDGEPLVGVLCGPVGKKVRYYRHRRGRRGYRKDSVFNRLFPAEPLEKAILQIVQEILADLPQLREQILQLANEQSKVAGEGGAALEELRKQRDQVRKRTELIVSTLDEDTLADARPELERMRTERRGLDEQIIAAEAAEQARLADPQDVADRAVAHLAELSANLPTTPTFLLRKVLGTLIGRIVGDMETKRVEVLLSLAPWALAEQNGTGPMRLVGSGASSTSYETHPHRGIELGIADCQYIKLPGPVCFECRRRPRAA